MTLLRDLKMYWRFGSGLRSFLDHTLSLEEARKTVERRMAERDKNFLRLVERGIFGYTQSPYLPLRGIAVPRPEPVNLDNAVIVARWAAETLKSHGACMVRTTVSLALRVCVAAHEQGLDLRGAVFWGGSEPPTATKVKEMNRVGARYIPTYWFIEAGVVGLGCAQTKDVDDIHLFKDCLALVRYPRQVPNTAVTVDAFHFTTLLPTAPKLMLNIESDDYGIIETRSCGCALETYGFTDHLRSIRSFRKLTGEGVTLVGSDMVRILEEVLPAKFGGSPLDYQLAEEEDEQGFTRLNLFVSPKIPIEDEKEVIDTVLDAMRKNSPAGDFAQALWRQARTLRVQRKEPVWTARGKLSPLHLAK